MDGPHHRDRTWAGSAHSPPPSASAWKRLNFLIPRDLGTKNLMQASFPLRPRTHRSPSWLACCNTLLPCNINWIRRPEHFQVRADLREHAGASDLINSLPVPHFNPFPTASPKSNRQACSQTLRRRVPQNLPAHLPIPPQPPDSLASEMCGKGSVFLQFPPIGQQGVSGMS